MIDNINWYPGHMKKTRELIRENLRMVDLVIEVIDARIPVSSRNPIIDELVRDKPRLIVLNKSDLADEEANRAWCAFFDAGAGKAAGEAQSGSAENAAGEVQGGRAGNAAGEAQSGSAENAAGEVQGGRAGNAAVQALAMNSMSGSGVRALYRLLEARQAARNEASARRKPLRMMIVGVPNVGKSSLINRLTGRKSARTGDRPGVTRGKQWLNLENGMQLLDTPGILWPKFEDPKAGVNLALCGSIRDEILDTESLALELLRLLALEYPQLLEARYQVNVPEALRGAAGDAAEEVFDEDGFPVSPALLLLDDICRKRGWILPGKKMDYARAGRTLLDEFRAGKIGRITLEKPEDR